MSGAADRRNQPELPSTPDRLDHDQPAVHSLAQLQRRLDNLPDGHPSSPYREDGSRRASGVSLKDLQISAGDPDDQSETVLESEGRTEARDAPVANAPDHAKNATSDAWREAMPTLEAAWRSHLERWPEGDRTAIDCSGDEPGSWRGDGGQYLNTEENLVAEHSLDRVRNTETEISAVVKSIEADIPGARLVGLDRCLKGKDRFKEKVAYEVRAKPERSIDKIVNNLPDAIRYTYEFEASSYTEGYWSTHNKLTERGYEIEFCRNSWDDPQYRGLNTRWREPSGQVFEVQFHTPESFTAKQFTHQAYERIRDATTSDLERNELHTFQKETSDRIPLPEGALSIPDYRKKEE